MNGVCKDCKHYKQVRFTDGTHIEDAMCCANKVSERYKRVVTEKSGCDCFERPKPPLGVKPSYLTAESRITDLAEAIIRYTEGGCTKNGYEQIKTFAKEIYLQSDLALQMEGERNVYQSKDL